MTTFYSIDHNTAYKRGMPEIEKIVGGMVDDEPCSVCGRSRRRPGGDLTVRLGDTRARMWPDALACGDYPCFVVSERFVASMGECGIALVLGGRVAFAGPAPRGLSLEEAPTYFWVDGSRCPAAKMDFEARSVLHGSSGGRVRSGMGRSGRGAWAAAGAVMSRGWEAERDRRGSRSRLSAFFDPAEKCLCY